MEAAEACRYLIARVQAKEPRRWRQGLRRPPIDCASELAEVRLVAERRLCGVPELAARALVGWAEGRRPAVRLFHQPPVREVLALMASGRRPVSLLDGEGGLEFVLHDLCHLEKFADPAHHAAQVELFARLDRVIDTPGWAALEAGLDEDWRTHRDHVLADMNGSPVFLYLVLRARLQEACARSGVAADERVRQFAALVGVEAGDDRAALAAQFNAADSGDRRAAPPLDESA